MGQAVINGISYSLCEEYLFDAKGRMTNPNFWDYKIYTARDMPEMETIVVSSYEETGPYGAKSVGEIAINGPAPAIANAIYDAAGIRRQAGTHAHVINRIISVLLKGHPIQEIQLEEVLGHSRVEAMAGVLFGIGLMFLWELVIQPLLLG